jgi:hypothetical protein
LVQLLNAPKRDLPPRNTYFI